MLVYERAMQVINGTDELTFDAFSEAMWPVRFRLEREALRRDASQFIKELHRRGLVGISNPMNHVRMIRTR